MGKGGKNRNRNWKNLIQIQVHKDQGQDRQHLVECKYITYEPYELKKIKHDMDKDIRFKQLPVGTVRSVWELKLNRRKRGTRDGQDNKAYPIYQKTKGITWQNQRESTLR